MKHLFAILTALMLMAGAICIPLGVGVAIYSLAFADVTVGLALWYGFKTTMILAVFYIIGLISLIFNQ